MKRCIWMVALVVGVCAGVASAQEDGQVRLGFYNVLNLFDVFDDPYTRDEGTDVKPREEIEKVAAAIRQMNPDVLGVCEVENEFVLQAVVNDFLGDMGYNYVTTMPSNNNRGIKLGVISRYPIRSVTSYRWQDLHLPDDERTWRFARDLLHARIELPDGRLLHFFVVHLKSKGDSPNDPESASWRLAEAIRVREIIGQLIEQQPDVLAALVGDFNSNPDEPPTQTILSPADDGSAVLTDPFADLTTEERITRHSEIYPNTIIDYIVISPALAERYVDGTADVMDQSDITTGSDHQAVTAVFELGE